MSAQTSDMIIPLPLVLSFIANHRFYLHPMWSTYLVVLHFYTPYIGHIVFLLITVVILHKLCQIWLFRLNLILVLGILKDFIFLLLLQIIIGMSLYPCFFSSLYNIIPICYPLLYLFLNLGMSDMALYNYGYFNKFHTNIVLLPGNHFTGFIWKKELYLLSLVVYSVCPPVPPWYLLVMVNGRVGEGYHQ